MRLLSWCCRMRLLCELASCPNFIAMGLCVITKQPCGLGWGTVGSDLVVVQPLDLAEKVNPRQVNTCLPLPGQTYIPLSSALEELLYLFLVSIPTGSFALLDGRILLQLRLFQEFFHLHLAKGVTLSSHSFAGLGM